LLLWDLKAIHPAIVIPAHPHAAAVPGEAALHVPGKKKPLRLNG